MDSRARFEELYAAHCGAVRSFVHRRVPPAAADDAVADIFVIAWRRLDQAPNETLPWLLGIARGVLANRRRSETRQRALRERLEAETVAPVDNGPFSARGQETPIMCALRTLGQPDQEVLLLVAWDGLDRDQAARVLRISPGLFSVRLHRARRRFKRALAAQQDVQQRQTGQRSAVEVFVDER